MTRNILVLAMFALGTVGFTACGDDDGDTETTEDTDVDTTGDTDDTDA